MKSGENLSTKNLNVNLLRFQPSMFHVSAVNIDDDVVGEVSGWFLSASTELVDLSEHGRLNTVVKLFEQHRVLGHQRKLRNHHFH